MTRRGVVTLVSGGLDSLVLVQTLLRRGAVVFPVYVRCGLAWESAERRGLAQWLAVIRQPQLNALYVLEVPLRSVYGSHWSLTGRGVPSHTSADVSVELPGRNVLLLAHAAVHASRRQITTVALGTLAGNPFADATPRFFKEFAACLSRACARPMQILAPLRAFTKAELIAAHPTALFRLTVSCLRPRIRRHCGRCNKCAERQRAFQRARVLDPTVYAA